jgi:hypothetical protein
MKTRASATVLGTVLGELPDRLSPGAEEILDLLDQMAAMDGDERIEVTRYLSYAKDLGFDPQAADILRRAITAGADSHARNMDAITVEARAEQLKQAPARAKQHSGVVYYMRTADTVKIGTTTSISTRFTSLGAEGILAIEHGSYDVEGQRHRQFAHLRERGEWFSFSPEIAEHVVAVRARFAELMGISTEAWLATQLPKKRQFAPCAPRT